MSKIKRIIEIDEDLYESTAGKNTDQVEPRQVVRSFQATIADAIAQSKPYDDSGDLISREALKEAIRKCEEEPDYQHDGETWQNGLYMAETLIDNALTVEPKRQEGVWTFDEKGYFYCGRCGKYPYDQYATTDFCPKCGADMRGETNGNTN